MLGEKRSKAAFPADSETGVREGQTASEDMDWQEESPVPEMEEFPETEEISPGTEEERPEEEEEKI